jgi:hypothetical protein
MWLANLVDRLFGCSHRKTTLPRSPESIASADGRMHPPVETYLVCLECGRHLPYDWAAMRPKPRRAFWSVRES